VRGARGLAAADRVLRRHRRRHRGADLEAVAGATLPLPEGLLRERALFEACMDSPQRAGLIHAFFAERAVARIPEAGAAPRDITSVGVIGGGTMGAGIASACLIASASGSGSRSAPADHAPRHAPRHAHSAAVHKPIRTSRGKPFIAWVSFA